MERLVDNMKTTEIIKKKKEICKNVDKVMEILDKKWADLTPEQMDEVHWLDEFLQLDEKWNEIHK